MSVHPSPDHLSTSPTSVVSALNERRFHREKHIAGCDDLSSNLSLGLEEFLHALPNTIHSAHSDLGHCDGETDPIAALFRRLDVNRSEWDRFEFFDSSRNYTRNLISTDGDTYTLILLCWNAGKESPIHDHPCDGCYMRVLEGSIRESRYFRNENEDKLDCTADEIFKEGDLAFIKDSIGYHKIGNPTKDIPAVTMHLYSPPFQRCQIWPDPSHASRSSSASMCYYSEYGRLM
uniref:Cysteine dioxygenase n=1 Tax=Odontella aurita TaxID=265563 RepID=A0A7S4MBD2_9STRA|mmetsp:Transcript_16629/g.47898  ORF Transcript_16629/g.47898 Transcript_16629/m.47898 type:complete len:233 (+) Transcript_16629:269-967(+)